MPQTSNIESKTFSAPLCQPDFPVFAIGDIHGRADLLEIALHTGCDYLAENPTAKMVLLGDLIDRGPDSWLCLRFAAAMRDLDPARHVLLAGNHEQMMLASLYHPDPQVRGFAFHNWRRNGGSEFFADGETLDAVRSQIRSLHLEPDAWQSHLTSGNVLFVHAGVPSGTDDPSATEFLAKGVLDLPVNPGMSHDHWAWIRDEPVADFMPWIGHFVVNGHTPWRFTGEPVAGRLNLDGGVYKNNRIAAGIIEPEKVTVITYRG